MNKTTNECYDEMGVPDCDWADSTTTKALRIGLVSAVVIIGLIIYIICG